MITKQLTDGHDFSTLSSTCHIWIYDLSYWTFFSSHLAYLHLPSPSPSFKDSVEKERVLYSHISCFSVPSLPQTDAAAVFSVQASQLIIRCLSVLPSLYPSFKESYRTSKYLFGSRGERPNGQRVSKELDISLLMMLWAIAAGSCNGSSQLSSPITSRWIPQQGKVLDGGSFHSAFFPREGPVGAEPLRSRELK